MRWAKLAETGFSMACAASKARVYGAFKRALNPDFKGFLNGIGSWEKLGTYMQAACSRFNV